MCTDIRGTMEATRRMVHTTRFEQKTIWTRKVWWMWLSWTTCHLCSCGDPSLARPTAAWGGEGEAPHAASMLCSLKHATVTEAYFYPHKITMKALLSSSNKLFCCVVTLPSVVTSCWARLPPTSPCGDWLPSLSPAFLPWRWQTSALVALMGGTALYIKAQPLGVNLHFNPFFLLHVTHLIGCLQQSLTIESGKF